jgi:hypothetical protein
MDMDTTTVAGALLVLVANFWVKTALLVGNF